MQPSPMADTSSLLLPSFRFCIGSPSKTISLNPRVGSNAADAVARFFLRIAYFSCNVVNHWRNQNLAYLLLKAQRMAVTKTEFIVLQKAA